MEALETHSPGPSVLMVPLPQEVPLPQKVPLTLKAPVTNSASATQTALPHPLTTVISEQKPSHFLSPLPMALDGGRGWGEGGTQTTALGWEKGRETGPPCPVLSPLPSGTGRAGGKQKH